MSDNKDAQAARNAADRRLREAHPNDWRTFMQEEFAQRGLEWTPRPSKEERERKAAAEKEERALARIAKIAKDNGLSAEAANRVLIAVQGETVEDKATRISDEAEQYERENAASEGEQQDEAQHAAAWR